MTPHEQAVELVAKALVAFLDGPKELNSDGDWADVDPTSVAATLIAQLLPLLAPDTAPKDGQYKCERCDRLVWGGDHVCPGALSAADAAPLAALAMRDAALYAIAGWEIPTTAVESIPIPDEAALTAAAMTLPKIKEVQRVLREIIRQIDAGGSGGKVFSRDNCIADARKALAALPPASKGEYDATNTND